MGRKLFLLLLVFWSILSPSSTCAAGTVTKKFIQLGWDIPNTTFLREHSREMEATAPFDGLMFKLELTDDQGQSRSSLSAWDAQPWKREWLSSALADLQDSKFTKFTDNFLRINASPGDLDWSNDAGWTALADKVTLFAWLAKQGGAKGLVFDFESYQGKQFQFDLHQSRHFADARALARRRGAEVMRGISSEFPDAVVLGLWLNSINFKAGESEDPDTLLIGARYGLLPAFINGMLDAMPPPMTLVDGCEFGYYYDGMEEYLRAAAKMRSWSGPASLLVAPENRARWRAQVQAGFGFYLDMYVNEPGTRYYFGPKKGGTRLDRLHDNLAAASAASDRYVWLFGEQSRWWNVEYGPWVRERVKTTVGKGRHWEEIIPGLIAAIAEIKAR